MQKSPLVLEVAMEMALPHDFLAEVARRFGPEKARDCAMSTSVGGIGPLLRERVFAQGDAGVDVIGVSLLYDAVWAQSWHEWGQIHLERRRVGPELRQMLKPTDLGFTLTFFDGKTADVKVWEIPYGRATVFFLDVPGITDVVYPGPRDMPPGTANPYAWAHDLRLRHSWAVGRGALQLCQKLGRRPDLVVLSETPTLFAHHRLSLDSFSDSEFFAYTRYIFNDHTPLEYAHPIWDAQTIETVKLDPANYIGTPSWNPQRKTLDVTSLLVGLCEGVFGVAKKHGDVMRAMPSLRVFANKIRYITNGVRRADWQAPEFANADALSDEQLLQVKRKYKAALLAWAWRHCRLWPAWAREKENSRLIVWTRRITPYKRLDVLVKMLKTPEYRQRFLARDVVVFVGGRIHQQDNHAQDIVYDLLELLNRDRDLQSRIILVDNFNVWDAPFLFQGADASIMMADDTREASATGFMKAQMNGAAIIATADGAVPEFVHFAPAPGSGANGADKAAVNGFQVPYVNGEPTPVGLLEAFEAFDDALRSPGGAAGIMRAAIGETKELDVARTVEEMKKLYDEMLAAPLASVRA